MSLLYNDDFIFKFINIYKYIHISLSSICQSGYKLLLLSLLFCGCQSSCCLLSPTNHSTFMLTEDLSLLPGIQYILSQDFVLVVLTFLWVLGLHTGTRLGCVNLTIQQKPTSARMNVLREGFRDFTFRCAHNYFTCGGTDWFGNYKIRCRATSDVKNRLSSPACRSKTKKRVSNIKHFQMLKLMFYLKITMLMLSLLLLLFVCLLQNEKPLFPTQWNPGFTLLMNILFVDTMSVPHASWQTENTVVWITVC